jgi:hypothetical protein
MNPCVTRNILFRRWVQDAQLNAELIVAKVV